MDHYFSFGSGAFATPHQFHHPQRYDAICFDSEHHQGIQHSLVISTWLESENSEHLALTFCILIATELRSEARQAVMLNCLSTPYAPRSKATYALLAIHARWSHRLQSICGSLLDRQCGRVSIPCRAASSVSRQGRRERFATLVRRQARQGDFRNVILFSCIATVGSFRRFRGSEALLQSLRPECSFWN
jgi:hypothetical protein